MEARLLSSAIKVPYSFTLVQLGQVGWEKNYLDSGYLPRFVLIDETLTKFDLRSVCACLSSLPLASESIDVLILPHTLEYVPDQHQLLREVERVLKPEGQAFILGFQRFSFYRLYAYLPGGRHAALWRGRPVSQHTLLDRLSLLNFAAEICAYYDFHALYSPTRRWWGIALWSLGYAVRAIKRTYTMIPINPIATPCPDWTPEVVPTIQRKIDDT